MAAVLESLKDATIHITQEVRVQAPIATTFAALLEQLSPVRDLHPTL